MSGSLKILLYSLAHVQALQKPPPSFPHKVRLGPPKRWARMHFTPCAPYSYATANGWPLLAIEHFALCLTVLKRPLEERRPGAIVLADRSENVEYLHCTSCLSHFEHRLIWELIFRRTRIIQLYVQFLTILT